MPFHSSWPPLLLQAAGFLEPGPHWTPKCLIIYRYLKNPLPTYYLANSIHFYLIWSSEVSLPLDTGKRRLLWYTTDCIYWYDKLELRWPYFSWTLGSTSFKKIWPLCHTFSFLFLFSVFFGPDLQHVEVPRLGVKLEM